jgi:hypothetical protein
MKLTIRVTWTEWFFGIWWWPIKKDRTVGIILGPVSFTWTRKDWTK